MKKLFAVTLGILSAVGGFVDIGDLVANSLVGARFGMSLAWVVVVGGASPALEIAAGLRQNVPADRLAPLTELYEREPGRT
ncbi:hypothetical protein [Nonomuraea sp. NPDC049607]|uniref:hypothetical protein n=1 Tax=Nonomuraea sp. NPDC049607 TaxID=3154732 RepID=UPI0034200849